MSMRALDRKRLSDLWRLRVQGPAAALVMGSGIVTYVLSHTTTDSLQATQRDFYREGRFADGFASYLSDEIRQLEAQAWTVPPVFLGVTAGRAKATRSRAFSSTPTTAPIDDLYTAIKETPRLGGVMNLDVALRSFRDTMGRNGADPRNHAADPRRDPSGVRVRPPVCTRWPTPEARGAQRSPYTAVIG